MKVICKFNDPSHLPCSIPANFDYGLELNKEYVVMGLLTYKKSENLYFLIDESGRPGWFPFQIFKLTENTLHSNWHLKINVNDQHSDYYNLIGFQELCSQEGYFNKLLERDEVAMQIYFRRKIEYEKELADEKELHELGL